MEVALCATAPRRFGKRVRIAANAFIFSVNRSHRLGCAEEGLQMMENSVEEITVDPAVREGFI